MQKGRDVLYIPFSRVHIMSSLAKGKAILINFTVTCRFQTVILYVMGSNFIELLPSINIEVRRKV
jgi:hypothetical protein